MHWLLQRVHTNHHRMISIDCQFFCNYSLLRNISTSNHRCVVSVQTSLTENCPISLRHLISINRTKVRQTANKCSRKSWKSCIIDNYYNWWIRIHDQWSITICPTNVVSQHYRYTQSKGVFQEYPFRHSHYSSFQLEKSMNKTPPKRKMKSRNQPTMGWNS